MKVLFVHLGREHLGIEYLSAMLKRAGHETVSAVDIGLFGRNDNIFYIPRLERLFSLSESIVEKFRRERPDVVCMSAYSSTLKWCFETAEKLKSIRDAPILLGGIHITLVPESAMLSPAIDYGVRGEAESIIVELISRIEAGRAIEDLPGIIFRKNGDVKINPVPPLVENIDTIPFPDKGLFDRVLNIRDDYMTLTSRGCPFSCAFCCEHAVKDLYRDQKYLRLRSVGNLLEELNLMKAKYHYNEVFLCSPAFPGNKEWAAEFSGRYRKEIGVPFWCFSHVNYIDAEYAKLLKEAGCRVVEFGVQTLNEPLRRDVLKRRETNERIAGALRDCDAAGLSYDADCILNLPGEREEDYEKAVRFFADFKNIHRVKIFNLTLFPGAKIVDHLMNLEMIDCRTYDAIREGVTGDFFHVATMKSPIPKWKIKANSHLLRLMPIISHEWILKRLEPSALRGISRIPGIAVRLVEMFYLIRKKDLRFTMYLRIYLRNFFHFMTGRRSA